MHTRIRILISFAILATAVRCTAFAAAGQDGRQLRVTIIAVTQFDHSELANKPLIDSINAATTNLQKFFETADKVEPTIFSTRDDTTAAAIRRWLFNDLSHDTDGPTIHLIFILTHGEGYRYPGPTSFKSELFLATSDTPPDNYYGTAIRGFELIDALLRLPRGSSAFVFLDTCGSGAIDNGGLTNFLEVAAGDNATRMMVFAGSMPNENAFRARFTNALVSVWQSARPDTCHRGQDEIADFIKSTMDSIDKLDKPFSQNVSLVLPFTPDFCIESFASQGALALIANTTDEPLDFTIHLKNNSQLDIHRPVAAHKVRAQLLLRQEYSIEAKSTLPMSPLEVQPQVIDLSGQDFVKYVSLSAAGPAASAVEPAVSWQLKTEAAAYAENWGAPPQIVAKLRTESKSDLQAAFQRAGVQTAAARELTLKRQASTQYIDQQLNAVANQYASAEAQLESSTAEMYQVDPSSLMGSPAFQRQRIATLEKVLQEKRGLWDQLNHARANEAQLLASAEESFKNAEYWLAIVKGGINADLNSVFVAATQEQQRAQLLSQLHALFPAQETARGLVITIPNRTSVLQLEQLGKILSAVPSPKLIEIESRAFGENPRKNQATAFQEAHRLEKKILRGTGIDPNSVVARGRPTLPEKSSKEMLDEVIISGDFMGKAPTAPE